MLAALAAAATLLVTTPAWSVTADNTRVDGPATSILDSFSCGSMKVKGVIKTSTGEKGKVKGTTDDSDPADPQGFLYLGSATPGAEFPRLPIPYTTMFANMPLAGIVPGVGRNLDDSGGCFGGSVVQPLTNTKVRIADSVFLVADLPMFGDTGDQESSLAVLAMATFFSNQFDDDTEGGDDLSGTILDMEGVDTIDITAATAKGIVKMTPDFSAAKARFLIKAVGQVNYTGPSGRPSVLFKAKVKLAFKTLQAPGSLPLDSFDELEE